MNGDEKVRSQSPRRPSQSASGDSRSPLNDSSTRRRGPEISSPLTFGARGTNIRPVAQTGAEPPPLPNKAERREKGKYDDREKRRGESERRKGELNGLGHDIHVHGTQERPRRI